MDGVLEQILIEIKEIKQLLADERNDSYSTVSVPLQNNTMNVKEAAQYLGITEFRLRALTAQGEIRHFKAGMKFLYKRKTLDLWLEEVQNKSTRPGK